MSFKGENCDEKCTVTAMINAKESALFVTMALSLGIPVNSLVRRLIQYFLSDKISWTDMFGHNKLLVMEDSSNSEKKQLRTKLAPEQYSAFTQKAKDWGSTPSVTVRQLVLLYVAGEIERRDIWD
jgi:hypothetical protein